MDDSAEEQVEAFLEIAKSRYGLSDNDISRLIGELVRLQKRSAFARRMGEYTAKAIITLFVASFFSGVAWAFMHFVNEVK